MDSPKDGVGPSLHDSAAVELTGKIMVVAVIVLFLVVVFVLFLHLYAKWFWWRLEETTVPSREARNPRRRRFVFAPGQDPAAASLRTGLDPSLLRSLPVLIFNPEDFKEGLECAVCLAELAQGEKARLLPKCSHGFHVECIDMWFRSHSTCPICRNPVAPESDSAGKDLSLPSVEESSSSNSNSSSGSSNEYSSESLNFPTNVLFWGNETQVSIRGACLEDAASWQPSSSNTSTNPRPDGMLVIDIPRPASEALAPEEELKSPMTTRLRSLKRLLSKEKRVSPCSSSCVDAEQLGRSQNS